MLHADKLAFEANLAQDLVAIQMKELDYLYKNLANLGGRLAAAPSDRTRPSASDAARHSGSRRRAARRRRARRM